MHETNVALDIPRVIWRQKTLILASVIVFGGVAYLVSLLLPASFGATVVMLVNAGGTSADSESHERNALTYGAMVASETLAVQVIDEFGLDVPAYDLTPRSFMDDIVEVRNPPGTEMITATVRLRNPDLAARVANRLGDLAVELADELARAPLDAERARLASAQQQLEEHDRLIVLNRSIDQDAALLESSRARRADPRDLLELRLRDEHPNPVYEALQREVAAARNNIAAMQERRQLQIVSRATPPRQADFPRTGLNVLVGVLVGLILSVLLVVSRAYLSAIRRDG